MQNILPYIKNGKIYFINKTDYESLEHYYMRCNFIASQEPQNQEQFNTCTTYSHIFINNLLFRASYSNETMEILTEMKKKIYDK